MDCEFNLPKGGCSIDHSDHWKDSRDDFLKLFKDQAFIQENRNEPEFRKVLNENSAWRYFQDPFYWKVFKDFFRFNLINLKLRLRIV